MVFGHKSSTAQPTSTAAPVTLPTDEIIQKLNQLSVVVNKIFDKVNDLDKRIVLIEQKIYHHYQHHAPSPIHIPPVYAPPAQKLDSTNSPTTSTVSTPLQISTPHNSKPNFNSSFHNLDGKHIHQISPPNPENIKLMIGGHYFEVSPQILKNRGPHFFTSIELDPNTELKIDRSARYFNIILHYLQGHDESVQKTISHLNANDLNNLELEAQFYAMEPLQIMVSNVPRDDTWTLDPKHKHSCLQLSANQLSVQKVDETDTATVIGTKGFLHGVHKWKVTFSHEMGSGYWNMVGVCDKALLHQEDDNDYEHAFGIATTYQLYKMDGLVDTHSRAKELFVTLDMDARKLYIDGKGVSVSAIIPAKITNPLYPIFNLFEPGNEIEVTILQ